MLFSLLCASAAPGREAVARSQGWTDARLARLTERRDILRRVAREYRVRYEYGQADIIAVRDAGIAALRADLELSHSWAERIALREEWLTLAWEAERAVEERFRDGKATQVQIYEAQIARLEAQIFLEREKPSASPTA